MKKDDFYPQLRKLVIPIAVQSFMLALVSVTDAVMLGAITQDAMSAASMAGYVQFFLSMLVTSFSTGIGIMTAQYWGKKDCAAIERIAPIGMRVILLIGGAMMLAAWIVPSQLMWLLTNDANLIRLGVDYLIMVAPSYLLVGITQVYFALLKNTGHAKESSAIGSLAVVINIVLNAVLIFGLLGLPAMGIRGAALATSLTRAVELIIAVVVTRRKSPVQVRWHLLLKPADPLLRKDFYFYTYPVIGASLVWGVAYIAYSAILGHIDGDAVAANTITGTAKNLLSCFIRGVGGGAGIMIGNLLGADLLDKAKDWAKRLTKAAALVGLITGGLLIVSTPFVVRVVPLTERAAGYLMWMQPFIGLNVIAQSINHTVLDGIFCAGGDSKFDMDTNLIFMWCICLPLGLLGAFVLHLPAPVVFCILNMDEIIKLPVVFKRYGKYIWLRNITR